MKIMIAIIGIIALISIISINISQNVRAEDCNQHCQTETTFAISKGTTKDDNNNYGFMEIDSDTTWSGSVLDTQFSSSTQSGSGVNTLAFPCKDAGIYSLVMQKQTAEGYLHIKVVKQGTVLKEGQTTAEYGIVQLAGNC